MLKKIIASLATICALSAHAQTDALFIDSSGRIGVGTPNPRARLDVGTYIDNGVLGTVMGRLEEGDTGKNGTYLGVRGFSTQTGLSYGKSFSIEHSFYGSVNSAISFHRGPGINGGFITFSTDNNHERMRIDAQGNVVLGALKAMDRDIQINSPVRMNGNPIYFHGGEDKTARILPSNTPGRFQLDIRAWDGVSIGCIAGGDSQMVNVTPNGVGIKTAIPRAALDVATLLNSGQLGTVMARLPEADAVGEGTYLGVRGFSTQPQWCKSFAIEHCFGNGVNNSIAFYRGGGGFGGWITFSTDNNTEKMRITSDGRVGIGTTNPAAALDVQATANDPRKKYAFIDGLSQYVGKMEDRSPDKIMSILGRGCIGTESNFLLFSDARIKKRVGVSDGKNDLNLLNRLRVTDYKYIDEVAHGSAVKKGFIAQEVEEIFPQAVTRNWQCVPDIFSMAAQVKQTDGAVTFTMKKEHHLANGDVVKIITDSGEEQDTVTVINATTFTITNTEHEHKDAFVYGKFVNDFRMVDYDRLFTLNVSATQELSKEVNTLKTENEELKDKLNALQGQVEQILTKLNSGDNTITASAAK